MLDTTILLFAHLLYELARNQDVGEWWNGYKAPVYDIKD